MNTVGHNFPQSNNSANHPNPIQDDLEVRIADDGFVRSMAVRYTAFDPDVRTFVMPSDDAPETAEWAKNWKFEKMPGGYHWMARGLFDLTGLPPAPPSRSKLTRPRFRDIFQEIQAEGLKDRIGGDRRDPLHYIPQLKQVRIVAEARFARGILSDSIAFTLAATLGDCRLFDVSLDATDDFTLTPLAAVRAARHALALAREEHESTQSPPRNQCEMLEHLETRMDLWAALLAMEEALDAASARPNPGEGSAVPELDRLLKVLRRSVGRIDTNLQRLKTILQPTIVKTYLLANWRRLLAPAHRDLPPWWLDGCLG
jgi:hypothetical protein